MAVGAEALHAAMLKTWRPRRVYAAFVRAGVKIEGPSDIAEEQARAEAQEDLNRLDHRGPRLATFAGRRDLWAR